MIILDALVDVTCGARLHNDPYTACPFTIVALTLAWSTSVAGSIRIMFLSQTTASNFLPTLNDPVTFSWKDA